VTHDELRSRLGAYAAATLDTAEAEPVRAHLADGCPACLNELYRLPVGLPAQAPAAPAPDPDASRVRPTVWSIVSVLALLMLAAGLSAGVRAFRRHDATLRAQAERAAARARVTARERDQLVRRVQAGERELWAARAAAERQAAEVSATTQARIGELERDLAVAESRIDTLTHDVARRETEIDRLLAGVEEGRTLHELLSSPGAELLRLEPVAPYRDARGHLLWHPGHAAALLYAFDLPANRGVRYRVHLLVDGDRRPVGAAFSPGPRGDVALALRIDAPAARVRGVEIVLDHAGEPVLAGQLTRAAGG